MFYLRKKAKRDVRLDNSNTTCNLFTTGNVSLSPNYSSISVSLYLLILQLQLKDILKAHDCLLQKFQFLSVKMKGSTFFFFFLFLLFSSSGNTIQMFFEAVPISISSLQPLCSAHHVRIDRTGIDPCKKTPQMFFFLVMLSLCLIALQNFGWNRVLRFFCYMYISCKWSLSSFFHYSRTKTFHSITTLLDSTLHQTWL